MNKMIRRFHRKRIKLLSLLSVLALCALMAAGCGKEKSEDTKENAAEAMTVAEKDVTGSGESMSDMLPSVGAAKDSTGMVLQNAGMSGDSAVIESVTPSGEGEDPDSDSATDPGAEESEPEEVESEEKNLEVVTDKGYLIVDTATLNVRNKPSKENSEVVGMCKMGMILTKTGKTEEFYEIEMDGKKAYVSRDFVREPTEEEKVKAENGETTVEDEQMVSSTSGSGKLVVIDAGHQRKGNNEKEPNGPGSPTMKAKVTGGTSGRTTGLPEYELTLAVALKLKATLQARGYQVIMVRESNDVNISNAERAQVANNAGAGAFIRIHANGSDNPSVHGAMTICPTPSNPYCSSIYSASRKLSDSVLNGVVAATGCKKEKVWETDTMSGINWCKVPVTIIEMGYMTNPEEDTLLASADYQQKMATGMANGIDAYFGN